MGLLLAGSLDDARHDDDNERTHARNAMSKQRSGDGNANKKNPPHDDGDDDDDTVNTTQNTRA
jgi:hypothetical protein